MKKLSKALVLLSAGVSLFFGCNTEDGPDNSETNNTVIGKPASVEPNKCKEYKICNSV